MSALREAFDERLDEVRAYLAFLMTMEVEAQGGVPKFQHADVAITPQQQKLLYAGIYLQLYNLVEATMTLCVQTVAEATVRDARWRPQDLSEALRTEWVRSTARTHTDLNFPKRLNAAKGVVDHLIDLRPLEPFDIEKGGGGSWDDGSIEKMSERLGCKLNLSRSVKAKVKRPIKNEQGALKLVKSMRNDLAHGSMSFAESADQVTVSELQLLAQAVIDYLGAVVDRFAVFVDQHEYLVPDQRPVAS
jgi:hypothetical protein